MLLFLQTSFCVLVLLTFFCFARWAKLKRKTMWWLALWVIVQTAVSLTGFYKNTSSIPPRFILVMAPPTLLLLYLFLTQRGKQTIASISAGKLTLIHLIRIPVELVLYGLFIVQLIPEIMTFSGLNFDILAGISAPFVYYFGYHKKQLSKNVLLLWNVVGLLLLLNIIAIAVLSTPFPFQQFGWEQPNVGLLQFPFVLLPGFVVPVVLFCHFLALKRLKSKLSTKG